MMKILMIKKSYRRKKKIISRTLRMFRMMNRLMMRMRNNMIKRCMIKTIKEMMRMKNKYKIKCLMLNMVLIKYKKKMIKNKTE